MSMPESADADYLVIGAGAGGAVIASRLSEEPARRVILIEAGPDLEVGNEPADIRSVFPLSTFNPSYFWPDTFVHWLRAEDSPVLPFPQGRVLGGTSAIMGMAALRGLPGDYDGWRSLGADGWGWHDVLPYFRRLERDFNFHGPLHGDDGPIPIRREPLAEFSPLARRIRDVVLANGDLDIADANADFRDGHCATPFSRFETSRGSAGLCYLGPGVRRRPNLRVETGVTIERLCFDGHRVIGAVGRRADGSTVSFRGGETIVTAGALRSPLLLMRSGIGPGAQLQRSGIAVVSDLAGVGANLQNHPTLYVFTTVKKKARQSGVRPMGCSFVRWSSEAPGCPAGDMALGVRGHLSWHLLGRQMGSISSTLNRPASRGSVQLDAGKPMIAFNFLGDDRDRRRLADGFRKAVALLASPKLRDVCSSPYVLGNPAGLMRYNVPTAANALRGTLGGFAMDLVPALRDMVFRRVADMRPATDIIASDDELNNFIAKYVSGTGHVAGTCRMGAVSDPKTVVDSSGRVKGVTGLRVADAAVMPVVPSGNTHIPVVMVAEKLAAAIA